MEPNFPIWEIATMMLLDMNDIPTSMGVVTDSPSGIVYLCVLILFSILNYEYNILNEEVEVW
jgi:hypothetical protein